MAASPVILSVANAVSGAASPVILSVANAASGAASPVILSVANAVSGVEGRAAIEHAGRAPFVPRLRFAEPVLSEPKRVEGLGMTEAA